MKAKFLSQVRTAASHAKRAQDKTTVRKSEFPFRSDGLLIPQTVQSDNALAVATANFTRDALERRVRGNCPDSQTFRQDTRYLKFDVADQTLERVYSTSIPAGGVITQTLTCDPLDRRTDATLVGASTVAAGCDDLGAVTNRISNSGLSDPGGRRLPQQCRSLRQGRRTQTLFLTFF